MRISKCDELGILNAFADKIAIFENLWPVSNFYIYVYTYVSYKLYHME